MGRYATCPHCGKKINLFNRIEKCAITGELVCSKCIVSSRFSDSIAMKVPEEFRQKFRTFNLVPFAIMTFIILYLTAHAWPSFVGWDTMDLGGLPVSVGQTLAMWLAAFLLALVNTRLPHLGSWMFYWWIGKAENYEKVKKAMDDLARGEYVSTNKLYSLRERLVDWVKSFMIEKGLLYWLTLGFNFYMLIVYFVITNNRALGGSGFSVFSGMVLVITIFLNISTLWSAAAFYCRKDPANKKQRYIIELLSWGYVILLPLAILSFVFGWLSLMGFTGDLEDILGDGIANQPASAFFSFNQTMLVIDFLLIMGLSFILTRLKPDYDWKKNDLHQEKLFIPQLDPIYKLIAGLVRIMLIFVLVLIFVLAIELLMVDFAMLFCVTSYYLATVYALAIFALLKMTVRKPQSYFRYKSKYWTLVKVSCLVLFINFLPTLGTLTSTNPSLENQFSTVFGADWEDQIPAELRAYMRDNPYSTFDQYFGFEVPINAMYEIEYMKDSPRFVKNRTTGEMLSEGEKYPGIVHSMIFDAYLPAGEEFDVTFDDGKPDKFPVIVYVHGIGMDRGAGNANWTSQYFANQGYLVCDMSYGFTGVADYPYTGGKERGYDYPDTIQQIGEFTKQLELNATKYHADMNNVYFAGRSFGGWMAVNLGWLYNTSFAGGNFSANMNVRGVIPYYPATDIPYLGSELMEVATGDLLNALDEPYINGSSNPEDPNYNPEWQWYNALYQAEFLAEPGTLAPVLGIQGTHDYLVPQGATKRLEMVCRENGHTIITGYYPFGSHGFDALHWSQYGQSIIYYMERFMALTRV